MDPDAKMGYLESSILEKLVTISELEPKANDCTEVVGRPCTYAIGKGDRTCMSVAICILIRQ